MTSTEDCRKRGAWGRGTVRKHHAGYEFAYLPVSILSATAHDAAPAARTLREAEKLRTKLPGDAGA